MIQARQEQTKHLDPGSRQARRMGVGEAVSADWRAGTVLRDYRKSWHD